MFELTMHVRDNQGQPTGRVKSIATDSPANLSYFYLKMRGAPKRGVKGRKKPVVVNPKPID